MKKKKQEKLEENTDNIRQISLTNATQNVFLISTFPEENLDFLINRALKVLKELKKNE
ncbi:MAG: hypothetical protein H7836_14620 [Magnetococcus sp. YQC-3]